MHRAVSLILATLVGASLAGSAFADSIHQCQHCAKHLLPSVTKLVPGRKYARDRRVDIGHVKLDVTPDFTARSVSGLMTMEFKPISLPLEKLELDAVDLRIDSVEATGTALADHQVTAEKLILHFAQPVAPDTAVSITVRFFAEPERGLYFRTPEMGYKPGDTQVWTQGEADLHRFWFPCYDYPNERFTSEVICHLPQGMEAVSNGVLLTTAPAPQGNLVTWHWKQDKPHVNYLIALAAGYFHKLEQKAAGGLPLALLVPPSQKHQAASAFRDTASIIEFYNREIGVPFPWDKYYQVYCLDFLAGGMENTSCTFEAARLLFNDDTEQIRSLRWLDAHETAHQWFGDLLTCRDWSHLWLNEGFASYYTILYEGERSGVDAMKYELWQEAETVFKAKDTRPTVWRDYEDPMQQFDSRVYPRGAWILHMIRARLGPELYRSAIRRYVERHRDGIVSSDDLQDVLEETSGLSFDRFCDQWLHHGAFPELKIDYSWDSTAKQAKLVVKQTQKLSPQVLLFHLPIAIDCLVKGEKAPRRFTIEVSQAEEAFYLPLPSQPELVRVDPDYTVLAKVSFQPPGPMLDKQLESDIIGRLLGVSVLAERKDKASVDKLAALLTKDSFYGVRAAAAKALAKIATPEARGALIAGLAGQDDARARLAVVEGLGSLPASDAQSALEKHAAAEKNPLILAAIIRSWSSLPDNGPILQSLEQHLRAPGSSREIIAAAAAALRGQDEAKGAPWILDTLRSPPPQLDTREYAEALTALGFISREAATAEKDNVYHFLVAQLTNPKEELRTAAAAALGLLRDPRALAVLKPMTTDGGPFNDPVRSAAAKSVQTLESAQEGPPELKNIWDQLQKLQKTTEEMRKQLDDADKKNKTAPAAAK